MAAATSVRFCSSIDPFSVRSSSCWRLRPRVAAAAFWDCRLGYDNASGFMETVEIPASVFLGAMFKKLECPCPQYESSAIGTDLFKTNVLFHSSVQSLQASLPPHSFASVAGSSEEATNNAATEAIDYMLSVERKVIKNYSYVSLQEQKKMNRRVQQRLTKRDEQLVKRTSKLIKTIVACDLTSFKRRGRPRTPASLRGKPLEM